MVQMLDHLNMTVTNVKETADWYGRVFGFEVVERGRYRGRPWAILKGGEAALCVYERPERVSASREGEGPEHRMNHFGLRIVDRGPWERTVEREGIEVEYGGPVQWPHSTSWYVRDPNGYVIEVALWNAGHAIFQ